MATNEELKDQLDIIESKVDSGDLFIKSIFEKNIDLVSNIEKDIDVGGGELLPNLKKMFTQLDEIIRQKMLDAGVEIPTQEEINTLVTQIVTAQVEDIELPPSLTQAQVEDIARAIIAGYAPASEVIAKPTILYPANNATDFNGNITFSNYAPSSTFKGSLDYVKVETAIDEQFTNIVSTRDDSLSLIYPIPALAPLTKHYVRVFFGSDNHLSKPSDTVSFTTSNAAIITPTIISPVNDTTIGGRKVTITTSNYTVLGHSEPQKSASWQIAYDPLFTNIFEESLLDIVNLTSFTSKNLTPATTYYARVKKESLTYESTYSAIVEFRTPAISIITPIITSPVNDSELAGLNLTITTDSYDVVGHSETQTSASWQIANDILFTNIFEESLLDIVNLTTFTVNTLEPSKTYYVRVKKESENYESAYSSVLTISTPAAAIYRPTIISPVNGSNDIGKNVILTTDAYASINHSEPQKSASWQIAYDPLFTNIFEESLLDIVNLTSFTSKNLATSTTYYARVKKESLTYESSYSKVISFQTKAQFTASIGIQGKKGFGVAPTDQPFALLGLAEMTGTNDVGHDNYGNYIHTNGSIVCWSPKAYYRVGHASSPRFATYGANALDIVGTDVFESEAQANSAGYALHRTFINAGSEQAGFFFDKYMNSKDGTSASKSVFGGVPISLATTAGYTTSNGMTGCTGILADAVVLSKARGSRWNTGTAFMYGYLALVSVAQAQAATNTTDVAWYDATGVKNYPKGCNNNALSDVDDTSITYATAGDTGNANKPKTGATANFAKTTHNGSNNGVADLNGGTFEVTIGITNFGSTATSTTTILTNTLYVLKHTVDIATLTGGWNGATDVWGNAANLATKYDSVTSPISINASGTVYWGNGTNAVLQNDLSGVNRDVCGFMPKNDTSMSATGINLFGNDYFNKRNMENLTPLACGYWVNSADAGVFSRRFNGTRATDNNLASFRASAYFA